MTGGISRTPRPPGSRRSLTRGGAPPPSAGDAAAGRPPRRRGPRRGDPAPALAALAALVVLAGAGAAKRVAVRVREGRREPVNPDAVVALGAGSRTRTDVRAAAAAVLGQTPLTEEGPGARPPAAALP